MSAKRHPITKVLWDEFLAYEKVEALAGALLAKFDASPEEVKALSSLVDDFERLRDALYQSGFLDSAK